MWHHWICGTLIFQYPCTLHSRGTLKLYWNGSLFYFTCLPNGLTSAHGVFTKLLKTVIATLRQKGHVSSACIHDVFLQWDTKLQCLDNVEDTNRLLIDLGFYIHKEKSIFTPTTILTNLVYVFNTRHITISLTREKTLKSIEAFS